MARVAVVLLVAYPVHLYWNLVPAFGDAGIRWHATNGAMFVAVGGIWTAAFAWQVERRRRAVPINEAPTGSED